MAIERFEDIEAWKAARELTQQIYKATNEGQFVRDHGLRGQVQRAAVSVMANIVHPVEYVRYLLFHRTGPVE